MLLVAVDFCGSRRTSTYYLRICGSGRSVAVAAAVANAAEHAVVVGSVV